MGAAFESVNQDDIEDRQLRLDGLPLLNLAHGLTDLLGDASEYCTPGHRMGRGYRLLLAVQSQVINQGQWSLAARAVRRAI